MGQNERQLSLRKLANVLFSVCLCVVCGTTAVWAQQPVADVRPAAAELPTNPLAAEQRYRIGPGDLLDIRIFGHPEMGREARVDPLGRIRIPFLDEMQAACLTEVQLARAIEGKLRKYLRTPQVDVLVKDYQSQPIAVIGAVLQPGRFLLQRRVRLLEMLSYAGGASLGAGNTVHLIRSKDYDFCSPGNSAAKPAAATLAPETGESVVKTANPPNQPGEDERIFDGTFISVNLRDLLNGALDSNFYVEPGDIISVPEADQIFLTGGVMRPGPIPLRQATTLLQAIGMAGGFYPDAAKKRIRLLRQVPGSTERKEELLDYEAIEKRKAPDIALQPNDLIEVPSSTAKTMGRSLLGLVVPTLGQLPLRVIRPY